MNKTEIQTEVRRFGDADFINVTLPLNTVPTVQGNYSPVGLISEVTGVIPYFLLFDKGTIYSYVCFVVSKIMFFILQHLLFREIVSSVLCIPCQCESCNLESTQYSILQNMHVMSKECVIVVWCETSLPAEYKTN